MASPMVQGHVISEIVRRLFIGTRYDAETWTGFGISVLEFRAPTLPPTTVHIPILDLAWDMSSGLTPRALRPQLEQATEAIDQGLSRGERVLVSCGMGIERSPLTVAWFLHRRRGMSLDDAYTLIRARRPEVESRIEWTRWDGL